MNVIDWSKFTVRCSAIRTIQAESRSNPTLSEIQATRLKELENRDKPLTEPMKLELAKLQQYRENGNKIILADTCIEYLMEEYAWRTARKKPVRKEFGMEATEKGKEVQPISMVLINQVEGSAYEENKERICNDYLSGEPDTFTGSLLACSRLTDIKSCWDYPLFLKRINTGLDNGHLQQVQGYGDITGCTELYVHYCLVNTPDWIILRNLERLLRSMNVISTESPEYLEKAVELENSMRFDDIPAKKRVHKIAVEPFAESERQKIYDRVKVCRDWLCDFDEKYSKIE